MLDIFSNEEKIQEFIHYFPELIQKNEKGLFIGNQSKFVSIKATNASLRLVLRTLWLMLQLRPSVLEKCGVELVLCGEVSKEASCILSYALNDKDTVSGSKKLYEEYQSDFCIQRDLYQSIAAPTFIEVDSGCPELSINCAVSEDDFSGIMKRAVHEAYGILAILEG